MTEANPKRRLRSQDWFDNPDHIDMTALYLERLMNYGLTSEELRSAGRSSALRSPAAISIPATGITSSWRGGCVTAFAMLAA